MMNKLILSLVLVGYAVAGPLSIFGQGVADLNKGFCLAFQDNQEDLTTACYVQCLATEPKIKAFFDAVDLTNNDDMTNSLQNMGIQFMNQFKDCRTTEFLFSLDNRLSDQAFLYGTVGNVGSQVGTYIAYAQMAGVDCDPTLPIDNAVDTTFCKLLKKHSINQVFQKLQPQLDKILAGAVDTDYIMIGQVATNFLLSVVNYKAPNVNTGLKPK